MPPPSPAPWSGGRAGRRPVGRRRPARPVRPRPRRGRVRRPGPPARADGPGRLPPRPRRRRPTPTTPSRPRSWSWSAEGRPSAPPAAVGAWLYGVAVPDGPEGAGGRRPPAEAARADGRRRHARAAGPGPPTDAPTCAPVLDEELARLPDKLRGGGRAVRPRRAPGRSGAADLRLPRPGPSPRRLPARPAAAGRPADPPRGRRRRRRPRPRRCRPSWSRRC